MRNHVSLRQLRHIVHDNVDLRESYGLL